MILNDTLPGYVTSYDYGMAILTHKYSEEPTRDNCKDLGFMPVGKNGWTEENEAGIIRKTKVGWVMRDGFPMQQEVDAAIISLREKGLLDKIFDKWVVSCAVTAS